MQISTRATTSRSAGLVLCASVSIAFIGQARAVVYNDAYSAANGGPQIFYDSGNAYPNVVYIDLGTSLCTGTLLNSRTVLTASHCLVGSSGILSTASVSVVFGANPENSTVRVPASALIPNSAYNFPGADIALISLTKPVTNVTPVTIAPAGYVVPNGVTVTQVGYGGTGTGSSPNAVADSLRRVATTALGGTIQLSNFTKDASGNSVLGGNQTITQLAYAAQFRNPLSPGNPDVFGLNKLGVPVLSTEGGVAPGDSGGPLFYNDPKLGLIELGDVIGGGQPAGAPGVSNGYGEVNAWTPTAVFASWLAANNPQQMASSNAGTFNWSNAAAWSGGVVPNNFQGIEENGGRPLQQVMVPAYYQVTLQNAGTITADISLTVDSLAITGLGATLSVPTTSTLTTVIGTTLSAGTLQLEGIHVTPLLTLNGAGALLSGHGTVQGNVANNAGVVAPGGSGAIGTMTVSGNYAQGSGGIVSVRLVGAASDQLVVGGTASLMGGTLAVISAGGAAVAPGSSFTVLSAAQVNGSFTTLANGLGAALAPSVSQSASSVSVAVAQVSFTDFAPDANATGVARTLNALESRLPTALLAQTAQIAPEAAMALGAGMPVDPSGPVAAAQDVDELDTLSAAQLAAALDSIAPQGIHVQSDAARVASVVTSEAITTRLGNLRAGLGGSDYTGFAMTAPPAGVHDSRDVDDRAGPGQVVTRLPPGLGSFLTGSVVFGTGGPAGDHDFTTAGVTAGFDVAVGPSARVGLSLTYVNDNRTGTGGLKANTQSELPVAYGSWSPGQVFVDGYFGGGWNNASMNRPVNIGFDDYTARANARGRQLLAGTTIGLRYTPGAVSYIPFAAFDYSHAWFATINETGAGSFATSVNPRENTSARGSIGARAEYRWRTGWGVLVPSARATFTHDFGDIRDKATAVFQAAPDLPFAVAGPRMTNDYVTLGVALAVEVAGNVSLATLAQTSIGHGMATQVSLQGAVNF